MAFKPSSANVCPPPVASTPSIGSPLSHLDLEIATCEPFLHAHRPPSPSPDLPMGMYSAASSGIVSFRDAAISLMAIPWTTPCDESLHRFLLLCSVRSLDPSIVIGSCRIVARLGANPFSIPLPPSDGMPPAFPPQAFLYAFGDDHHVSWAAENGASFPDDRHLSDVVAPALSIARPRGRPRNATVCRTGVAVAVRPPSGGDVAISLHTGETPGVLAARVSNSIPSARRLTPPPSWPPTAMFSVLGEPAAVAGVIAGGHDFLQSPLPVPQALHGLAISAAMGGP